jgi:ankyrin repeat protein
VVGVVRELILAGANPNVTGNDGTTPLMSASFGCSEDIVTTLLRNGAQANRRDINGDSALMFAAGAPNCSDGRIVALLIGAGANVNEASKTGRTALIDAAWAGNEIAVQELVAAQTSLSAKVEGGKTALAIARDRTIGRKPSHDRIASFLANMMVSEER